MSNKKEGNQYDKIFKENLESVTLVLIEKVLQIQVVSYEKIKDDLQRTIERKPDQLLKITDQSGSTFLLHLEFQLMNEPRMVYRMLEYRGMLERKYELDVLQYVIFLSDQKPDMVTHLIKRDLSFKFNIAPLSSIKYELFLSSGKGDEIVFAILGDFGNTNPQQAARQIYERLRDTSTSQLELDRHLQQLRVLANLRKLTDYIETMIDSISNYIKEEDDILFKRGERKGKLEGEQKGRLEGEQKGKREAILKFLKDGILTTQQLATYFDVTEEFVEDLRKSLNT
ncbi:hypothetical protein QNI19_02785 [Cytophagaceae bacterium DM2B3-1]|uniref:Rpn family recombination-promoting nuclease/putative transposase n=1 Tax=Xanthocytophaga flava TaxID=3048013 RepID=A0ABT7CEA1_9BACT|nr:hypothetical protein [Xanthocytophaga flavus]MDJ1491841.1 hypothetical protein [Xanthocytophaga flavus]